APEDKVTDNKNGTIEVNGSSITPADDSKVAHLSGANNFNTVPTVNNNPLLLASSLPSDLARTGQANTYTAAQTFSIAPTIKDASKDKGDNQAATMADLKSVKASAWRHLTGSNALLKSYDAFLKIDESSNTGYIELFGSTNDASIMDTKYEMINLGDIVTGLYDISGQLVYNIDFNNTSGDIGQLDLMTTGNSIYLQTSNFQALSGLNCSTLLSGRNIVTFKYKKYVGG
ncbi:hypothetical protein KTE19_13135, partial [Lentilactobacillus sp. IMAU92037]|nr:hypothetical protein [Lentilactobacillus dabitei]